MLDCWQSSRQGKLQPIFNCEILGSHFRHARMFSSLPNILGRILNTPVKCLRMIARVELLKMLAEISNRLVALSRVSVRIYNIMPSQLKFLDDTHVYLIARKYPCIVEVQDQLL